MGQWWEDKPMADTAREARGQTPTLGTVEAYLAHGGESTVLDIGNGLLLTEPACTHTERGQTSEKA